MDGALKMGFFCEEKGNIFMETCAARAAKKLYNKHPFFEVPPCFVTFLFWLVRKEKRDDQCFGTEFAEFGSVQKRFIKLIIPSVVAANAGYTFFLLPALGILYPDKVPLSLVNIILFAAVSSLAGILLGISIFFLSKTLVKSVGRAAGLSVAFLWILYWIPHLEGSGILILFLDGAAALLTWIVFVFWTHKRN